jgi:molybdopterin synthase catalytic subunit
MISIQKKDFSLGEEYEKLRKSAISDGAIVTFTGVVRDFNGDSTVVGIELEHYPEMTHKSLQQICEQARKNWPLGQIRVIHRIGKILAHEQIVFVGVTSKHRSAAFEACQFIMDFLKTEAPLWKKEISPERSDWVDAKDSDKLSAQKWQAI